MALTFGFANRARAIAASIASVALISFLETFWAIPTASRVPRASLQKVPILFLFYPCS